MQLNLHKNNDVDDSRGQQPRPRLVHFDLTVGELPGPETAVFWLLSALRAHTKTSYKTDLHSKTLRALKRPGGPGQTRR